MKVIPLISKTHCRHSIHFKSLQTHELSFLSLSAPPATCNNCVQLRRSLSNVEIHVTHYDQSDYNISHRFKIQICRPCASCKSRSDVCEHFPSLTASLQAVHRNVFQELNPRVQKLFILCRLEFEVREFLAAWKQLSLYSNICCVFILLRRAALNTCAFGCETVRKARWQHF